MPVIFTSKGCCGVVTASYLGEHLEESEYLSFDLSVQYVRSFMMYSLPGRYSWLFYLILPILPTSKCNRVCDAPGFNFQ